MQINPTRIALSLLTFSLATSAHAEVFPSLTRATFQTAAPSLSGQDFDAFINGTVLTTVNGITYSSSTGSPVVTSAFLTSTSPNGLGRTGVGFFNNTDTATFTFADAITAFGIDINTFARNNGSYSVLLNTGDTASSIFESFPGTGTGQFIGFVSNTPFTSVTLSANSEFAYSLDTLLYGSRSAVVGALPEPATWAMMIIGFGATGFAMRRKPKGRTTVQFS